MNALAGPLLHLSLRRTGRHYGKKHTPQPPSNEDRYAAFLHACASLRRLPHRNDFRWPMKRQ